MTEAINLTKLRKIMASARPIVSDWLDISEQMASFSELCREEGLDWAQIKALLKAQEQDHRDGKDRVGKMIAKAGRALDYSQALDLQPPEKNISREPVPPHDSETGEIIEQPSVQMVELAAALGAAAGVDATLQAIRESREPMPPAFEGSTLGDPGEIPPFLRRH